MDKKPRMEKPPRLAASRRGLRSYATELASHRTRLAKDLHTRCAPSPKGIMAEGVYFVVLQQHKLLVRQRNHYTTGVNHS